eukprot:m.46271 g.46271  ORF g.46271 m.46271 type:complete len:904 (+) comp6294_c0_seq2:1661-4372(+)
MDIKVFARLRPAIRSDNSGDAPNIHFEGNRVLGDRGTALPSVAFDAVFASDSTNEEVYQEAVRPLVHALGDGFNSTLLLLGEAGAGKTFSLCGTRSSEGIARLAIQEIFAQLDDGRGGTKIEVCSWRVHNETVADLLQPVQHALELGFSATEGALVEGISKHEPKSEKDCLDLFNDSIVQRAPAPIQQSKVAYFFQIKLIKSDNTAVAFTMVALPSTEALQEDRTQARMREGPKMNQGITTLAKVAQELSDSSSNNAFSRTFTESKLTQLLHNSLGGNCQTRVLSTLSPFASPSLPKLLDLSGHFRQIVNYPVAVDQNLWGLEKRYRGEIMRLVGQLPVVPAGGGRAAGGPSIKAHELENKLVNANLDKMRLQEDNDKLYAKLLEVREKYNRLIGEKTDISTGLISSEEERLKVSKNLVDLQIENNKIREEAEAKAFEQVNKILTLENELLELQLRADKLTTENEELKSVLLALEEEKRDLTDEYKTLKTNYLNLTNEHRSSVAKNEELGVELLNLVNAKVSLMKERDSLVSQIEAVRAGKPLDKTFSVRATHEDELLRQKDRIERLQQDMQDRQVQLSQRNFSLEAEKDELEGHLHDVADRHTRETKQLRNQHHAAREELHSQLTALREKNTLLQKRLNKAEKEADDALAQAAQLKQLLASSEANREHQEATHSKFVAEYRRRLQKYVNDIADFMGNSSSGGGSSSAQMKQYIDLMLKDIANSYEDRQRQYAEMAKSQLQQNQALIAKYEQASHAYKQLRQQVDSQGVSHGDTPAIDLPSASELLDNTREVDNYRRAIGNAEKALVELRQEGKSGHNSLGLAGGEDTESGSWDSLRKTLREFTATTQHSLERERASLLRQCTAAEQKLRTMEDYMTRTVGELQREIMRLRDLLQRHGINPNY